METTYIWLHSFRGKCIQYTVVKANYNTNTANKRVMVSSSVFGSVVLHSHVVTTVRVHPTVSGNWKKSYKMKDVGEEEEKRKKMRLQRQSVLQVEWGAKEKMSLAS